MTAVVLRADARALPLPDACADLIVTSPPYFGLRSYTDGGQHYAGQVGSEATPAAYLEVLLDCTREWARVLKPCGSLFVNLGDKYSSAQGPQTGVMPPSLRGGVKWPTSSRGERVQGFRDKCLLGLPWRYAIGCTDQLGLILRAEIIWNKPNGLPESVTDRVRRAHEQVFHFTRQPRYYAAVDEIREPHTATVTGRDTSGWAAGPSGNREIGRGQFGNGVRDFATSPLGKLPGSVWSIPSQPLTVPAHLGIDHFAAFPMALPRRLILGWSPPGICTGCGEGRRPIVDKALVGGHLAPNARDYRRAANTASGGTHWDVIEGRTEATITGYACACPDATAPTRPAVIADPFGGTGTTALLADVHGRHGITFDMSADYCRLAAWRTADPAERARAMQVARPPAQTPGQATFDDLEAAWLAHQDQEPVAQRKEAPSNE